MKKSVLTLPVTLTALLTLSMLAIVFVRAFWPQLILPRLDIPTMVLLCLLAEKSGKNIIRQVIAWVLAAAAKFAALYAIVVWLICGVLSESLLASGAMKAPMLNTLPATFSWPQLVTSLIGGAIALAITPVLRKALHK